MPMKNIETLRQEHYEVAASKMYHIRFHSSHTTIERIEGNRLLLVNRTTGEVQGELHLSIKPRKVA